ncbi:MAG: hypothetical protein AB7O38_25340, partial [Pirellulaceae bacterium]
SLRVTLDPGERTRSVHVAFCPPLDALPDLCCEPDETTFATIEVAEAAAYGARFDVRLDQAVQAPTDIIIHFEALCPASATATSQDSRGAKSFTP